MGRRSFVLGDDEGDGTVRIEQSRETHLVEEHEDAVVNVKLDLGGVCGAGGASGGGRDQALADGGLGGLVVGALVVGGGGSAAARRGSAGTSGASGSASRASGGAAIARAGDRGGRRGCVAVGRWGLGDVEERLGGNLVVVVVVVVVGCACLRDFGGAIRSACRRR
jgi:hypothetical protein